METINFYLTAKEQKAAELIASGNSYIDVSKELKIDRTTLWLWKQKPTFTAYLNSLIKELKEHHKETLLSLHSDALKAINECLNSDNESIKLKTALYLLEKIESLNYGLTDAKEIIEKECTKEGYELDFGKSFDKNKFNALCDEFGIK